MAASGIDMKVAATPPFHRRATSFGKRSFRRTWPETARFLPRFWKADGAWRRSGSVPYGAPAKCRPQLSDFRFGSLLEKRELRSGRTKNALSDVRVSLKQYGLHGDRIGRHEVENLWTLDQFANAALNCEAPAWASANSAISLGKLDSLPARSRKLDRNP
jgi:hypothetical protein